MARTLEQDIFKIVGALGRVLSEEGRSEVASLISEAKVGFEETSYDNWNGGTYGYTLQLEVPARSYARLKDSHDDLESELRVRIERFTRLYPNEHIEGVLIVPSFEEELSGKAPSEGDLTVPAFWEKGSLRLFVSHVSKFKVEALSLSSSLSPYGVSGFVAHEDIEPTKEWEGEIRLALATCDGLVCLLTEGFNQSKWADQEVGFAIGRGVLVIPIRLGLDPYGFMGRYQGYSGLGKPLSEVASGLVTILAKHRLTRIRMAECLVSSFEGSNSFATAKRAAKNLSLVEEWSDGLVERVRQAMKENDQIADAWGVSAIVDRLLLSVRPVVQ